MRLTFNRLLDIEGIASDRVQLVRHQDARAGATTSPYALWVDHDPGFELYQSIQSRQVFRTDGGSLIAGFVVTPAAETLFVGLYGIHGLGTAAPGTRDPVGGHDVSGLNLYDLRPDPRLAFYSGKVVIEWGAGYRSWVQRAHKQDKEVVEVRREFREERFPGFVAFETTLSEIARLPQGWRAILSSSRGVYLLTCPRTREQYVGSATGEGGFVARWEQHAAKGGDAVRFRSRELSDYSVAVLEVAGSTASTHDVQLAEQRWIRKLRSIDMGLNGNPGGQPI